MNVISLNANATLKNVKTITYPLYVSQNTTGSNTTSLTPYVTSSWQLLDQGNNPDLLFGIFQNTDLTSSIYIALGNTGSIASILNPNTIDTCVLSYSGSTNVYAKSVGANPNPQLDYLLVAMN